MRKHTMWRLQRPSAAFPLALFLATVPLLVVHAAPDGDAVRFHLAGDAIRGGLLPYRDFDLPYPPGSIPLIALPSILAGTHWLAFYRLESVIGWCACIVLARALSQRQWTPFALALVPLALGPFSLMRLDACAAALALGAIFATIRNRPFAAFSLLAAGTLVKVWPIVLLPLLLLHRPSRRGLLAFAGIVAAGLAPFLVLAPVGSYNAFRGQVDRHLQLESIGSSVLLALGEAKRRGFDGGSWSVFGHTADRIALVQSAAVLLALVIVVVLFARSRKTDSQLCIAALAATAAFAFGGRVLSPQYLLWVAPLALLVPAAVLPFATACVLTREIYPTHYEGLIALRPGPIALLVARNVLLLVLLGLALLMVWRLEPESKVNVFTAAGDST